MPHVVDRDRRHPPAGAAPRGRPGCQQSPQAARERCAGDVRLRRRRTLARRVHARRPPRRGRGAGADQPAVQAATGRTAPPLNAARAGVWLGCSRCSSTSWCCSGPRRAISPARLTICGGAPGSDRLAHPAIDRGHGGGDRHRRGADHPKSCWTGSTSATQPRSAPGGSRHAARLRENAAVAARPARRGKPAGLRHPLRAHLRAAAGDVIRALGLDRGTGRVAAAGRFGVALAGRPARARLAVTGIAIGTLETMLLARYAGRASDRAGTLDAVPLRAPMRSPGADLVLPVIPPALPGRGRRLAAPLAALLERRVPAPSRAAAAPLPEMRGPTTAPGARELAARPRGRAARPVVLLQTSRGHALSCFPCRHHSSARARHGAPGRPASHQRAARRRLAAHTRRGGSRATCLPTRPASARSPAAPAGATHTHALPVNYSITHPRSRSFCQTHSGSPSSPTEWHSQTPCATSAMHATARPGRSCRSCTSSPGYRRSCTRRYGEREEKASGRDSRRIGIDPAGYRRADDLHPDVHLRHVPQLFWAFTTTVSSPSSSTSSGTPPIRGRRFCSLVLLARMLAALSWPQAIHYLDFPADSLQRDYLATFFIVRQKDYLQELAKRLRKVANEHAANGLIDYEQRRRTFSDWAGIDPQTWLLLQPQAQPPGTTQSDLPTDRAHASVWLWCELTGGDETAAPSALPPLDPDEPTSLIHDITPELRGRLLLLGELILSTPTCMRQTIPTRLAATLDRPRPALPL